MISVFADDIQEVKNKKMIKTSFLINIIIHLLFLYNLSAMEMMDKVKILKEMIEKSNKILFFTGAGISTNSGIADYRGPNGIWKVREPVYFDEFLGSDFKKIEYWDYMLEGRKFFKSAKPNRAHYSIVEIEKRNKLLSVITQNIDGLHLKAGTSKEKLIELHGNNSKAICLSCKNLYDIDDVLKKFQENRVPPKCHCGGYLKPDVVMFGESLDTKKLSDAFRIAEDCDLCISIGSSLFVQPASLVVLRAWEKRKPLVIVNIGDTEYDEIATLKINYDCEKVLAISILE